MSNYSQNEPRIVLVGAFPPPVHGMALVNQAVRERLAQSGVPCLVLDVAPRNLDRSRLVRLGRLPGVFKALARLVFNMGRGNSLYMSVSGGSGQIYELAFVFLARIGGMRLFLHHHSYAYLDKRRWLTATLVRLAGAGTRHIVLSERMGRRLQMNYGYARRVIAISNALLLTTRSPSRARVRTELKIIGFLGNISEEKGIFEVLAVAKELEQLGCGVSVRVAGPFQDLATERHVREKMAILTSVEYVGPKYDEDKEKFLEEIDVLLFPSKYKNEAEPLTVHEAMMHGVPVIAYGRGSLKEVVCNSCGLIVEVGGDFVSQASSQLQEWIGSPDKLQRSSKVARENFQRIATNNVEQWSALRAEMSSGQV